MSEPLSGRVVSHHGEGANAGGEPGAGAGPESGAPAAGCGCGGGANGGVGPGDRVARGFGGPGAVPSGWSKAWLVPVVFGVLSVALGILLLAWPGHTIGAMTVLIGLYLLVVGGYRFVHAIHLHEVEPVARVVALVLAVLSVGVGVVCLIDPFNTASAFAMVVGAFWLAAGAITVLGSRQRRARRNPLQLGRSPGAAGGYTSMIIGLLIVLFPHASLLFLAIVLGLWSLIVGLSAIATGLVVRSLLKNVAAAVLYWP
jgi:uncharacterized membrane protein HdeD (DUF308 family)